MIRIQGVVSFTGSMLITWIALLLYKVDALSPPGLGYPDFESKWLQMIAQDDSLSYLEIQHDLGQVPAIVDVLVKSQSEPNKGFIFKAIGTGVRDDEMPEEYGSIVYMYNETTVRLYAPNKYNSYESGYAIYTGEPPYWKGVNNQKSRDALVKVRCWSAQSLPATCYEASNFTLVAGSATIEETYVELEHNLVQRPAVMNVRAMLLDNPYYGWYIDGQGSNPIWFANLQPWFRTAGLVYGFNNESVRIWTSSITQNGNVIFIKEDGWGLNEQGYLDACQRGMIEVRAWCSLPYQFEKTIPVGPGISDESLEILFDLPEAVLDHDNIFVTVKVQPQDGENAGYYFDGLGGAFVNEANLGTPCAYGGIVYGYSETAVRLWRPDDARGAALCIGTEMGHGINSQASNSVDIVVTVWMLDYASTTTMPTSNTSATSAFTTATTSAPTEPNPMSNVVLSENTFEEDAVIQDACVHFHRLVVDAKPASSPYRKKNVIDSSNILNCYNACIGDPSCLTFVWDRSTCELFNTTEFQVFVQITGSEVWISV